MFGFFPTTFPWKLKRAPERPCKGRYPQPIPSYGLGENVAKAGIEVTPAFLHPPAAPLALETCQAVEHELATMQTTVSSFETPAKAVAALIDWHVQVALDPKVGGAAQPQVPDGWWELADTRFSPEEILNSGIRPEDAQSLVFNMARLASAAKEES